MRAMRVATTAAFTVFASVGAVEKATSKTSMVLIEGGSYMVGSTVGSASARPPHNVTLDPFLIDVYEVTNAQFATFLNTLVVTAKRNVPAGELRPDDVEGPDAVRVWGGSSGHDRTFIEMDDTDARIGIVDGRFAPEPGFADHPVSESTWRGAMAFCAWRGARLPTEVEWEAAARGKEGRTYPWGEALPSPEHAVFGRDRGETDAVGSHPKGATPEGVFDLSGNEAEWTSSLFKPYPYDAADGRGDSNAPGERVTRGGDHVFDAAPDQLTGYFRDGFSRNAGRGHRHIGFRCAKNAE